MNTYPDYDDDLRECLSSEPNQFLRIFFSAMFVTAVFVVPVFTLLRFIASPYIAT